MESDEDDDFLQLLDEVGLPRDAFAGDGDDRAETIAHDDPVLDFLRDDHENLDDEESDEESFVANQSPDQRKAQQIDDAADEDDAADDQEAEDLGLSMSPADDNSRPKDGENGTTSARKARSQLKSDMNGLKVETSKSSKRGLKERTSSESGDFLDWLVDGGDETPEAKHHREAVKLVSESESKHECDPEEESDLLARLQSILNNEGNASNVREIMTVCQRLGRVHPKYRADVWCKLLHTRDDVRVSPRQHGRDQQPSREDEDSVLKAMTESTIIRHAGLVEEQRRLGIDDPDEILRDAHADDLHVEVIMHTRVVVRAFDVEISLCDPGIADVVYVLASPILKLSPFHIAPLIQELRRKRVLLLQFPDDDAVVPSILAKRAKLLELVLRLHDEELAHRVFSIGPPQVVIPWRWWRCAFAGEVVVSSLLTIWDLLIVDACPENNGDEGPSHASLLTGVWEGCDPRGPLAVYMMIALLVKCRQSLMEGDDTSPQHFLDVLRSAVARIPASDAVQLCEEAKILRASTPLNVIEEAFYDDETRAYLAQQQKLQQQQKQKSRLKHAQESLNELTGSATGNRVASSVMAARENVSSVLGSWFTKSSPTTLPLPNAQSSPQAYARSPQTRTHDSKENPRKAKSWSDKMKLTLGFGGLSAETLAREKAVRDADRKSRQSSLQDQIRIIDTAHSSVEEELLQPQTKTLESVDTFTESKSDLSNYLPASAAQARHELSGLYRGGIVSLSILRPLKLQHWSLYPINLGGSDSMPGIMCITSYRIFFLQAKGASPPRTRKFIRRSQLARLGDLEQLTFRVLDARHLSEISHLIVLPSATSSFQDIIMRYHAPENHFISAFSLPNEDSSKLLESFNKMAQELFL